MYNATNFLMTKTSIALTKRIKKDARNDSPENTGL